MKNNLFKYVIFFGLFLIFISLIIIITKTPPPKPKPGSIDIIEKANINPADFGGDYVLLDSNGEEFDSRSLRGKYQLIYFGFTYCPDICPASVIEINKAIELVNQDKQLEGSLVPVFITVDPARDTTQQLKEYFGSASPHIIALTGNEKQISEVAKKFRVYYSIAQGAKEKKDYMVNHSSFFYLVGPDGKFIKHYVPGAQGEDIARDYAKIAKK